MKFITHNDEELPFVGGWLQGCIDASYAELKNLFGKPSENFDDYKSDAEWQIKFADGTRACIYNYKDGKNYCGKDGLLKSKIRNWHIGGSQQIAVTRVKDVIEAARK